MSLGMFLSKLPRDLTSCVAPEWIDASISFLRADRNDDRGCTLKRNITDWLEILTPKHRLSHGRDFFGLFQTSFISSRHTAKINAVIKCFIKKNIKLLLVKYSLIQERRACYL